MDVMLSEGLQQAFNAIVDTLVSIEGVSGLYWHAAASRLEAHDPAACGCFSCVCRVRFDETVFGIRKERQVW